jgi:hypothetical protein
MSEMQRIFVYGASIGAWIRPFTNMEPRPREGNKGDCLCGGSAIRPSPGSMRIVEYEPRSSTLGARYVVPPLDARARDPVVARQLATIDSWFENPHGSSNRILRRARSPYRDYGAHSTIVTQASGVRYGVVVDRSLAHPLARRLI